MKIKQDYNLLERHGQYIVVSKNTGNLPDNAIILKGTAVFLWKLLKERDVTKAEMLEAVLNEFDISTVLALGDIDVFVRTMKENGIIE